MSIVPYTNKQTNKQTNSVAWVRERIIPTERPIVGEVSTTDRGVSQVSAADPYGRILDFLDHSR
jgi:hypothetical protein